MKRFTKLVSILSAVSLLLSACSNGSNTDKKDNKKADSNEKEKTEASADEDSGDSEGSETVEAWTWDPNFNIKALEIAEETYKKDNPDFDLKIVENAQPDIVQSLNTNLSSGVTDALPDIVFIEDYRISSFLKAYPDAFYPMEDYFNPDDFAKYKVEVATMDDHVYGIPFDSGSMGTFVRTDVLEECGYTLDDLKDIDWSEYIEIGKDVHEKTGKYWITQDPNDLGLIRGMIQSSGSWYTKEDGKTPWIADNEALKQAFKDYKTMYDSGIMNSYNGWDQLLGNINSGEVVSTPTGNWFIPSITQEESQAGKWGVVPFPRQTIEGSKNASNLGGSSIYVLNGDNAEAAAKFLGATFGSNTEFYQDLVNEIGAIGTHLPFYDGEGYKAKVDYFGGQQIYQDFAKWTNEIPAVNFGSNTYQVEDIMRVSIQDYLNGADLDEVLQQAQEQAESAIQE